MRVICAPLTRGFEEASAGDLEVVLYGHSDRETRGSAGSGIPDKVRQRRLKPDTRAWDLLSLALAVVAADTGVRRDDSPDGWTRQIDLSVAVADPAFWTSQTALVNEQLRFLTTDLWNVEFIDGGLSPSPSPRTASPDEDCVSLLSGGLDSLVGALDLVTREKRRPYAVSQVSLGDKETQRRFASSIGGGLSHLQLNHNVRFSSDHETSQRARSIIFLTYGVLAATSLALYRDGQTVTLYMCENGFISINPPLTDGRLGALSTRTTHPFFLRLFQQLLDAAGLAVSIHNPYQFFTKGEMLEQCADQDFLVRNASQATSCGRFARNAYRHCGRCVPCLVRRAAIYAWGASDETTYVCGDLSRDGARTDDVRSAAMAVAQARSGAFDKWIATRLSTTLLGDVQPYRHTVERGVEELGAFLDHVGVK